MKKCKDHVNLCSIQQTCMNLIQNLYYKSTLATIINSNALAAKNKLKVNKNDVANMSDISLRIFTANFGHTVACWILSNCCFFITKILDIQLQP